MKCIFDFVFFFLSSYVWHGLPLDPGFNIVDFLWRPSSCSAPDAISINIETRGGGGNTQHTNVFCGNIVFPLFSPVYGLQKWRCHKIAARSTNQVVRISDAYPISFWDVCPPVLGWTPASFWDGCPPVLGMVARQSSAWSASCWDGCPPVLGMVARQFSRWSPTSFREWPPQKGRMRLFIN